MNCEKVYLKTSSWNFHSVIKSDERIKSLITVHSRWLDRLKPEDAAAESNWIQCLIPLLFLTNCWLVFLIYKIHSKNIYVHRNKINSSPPFVIYATKNLEENS